MVNNMKTILKIFLSYFLIFFIIFFAYMVRPISVGEHMHLKYSFEQRLDIFRLKLNYSEDLYQYLNLRYILTDECSNACYSYITELYTIGLKHHDSKDISNDILFILKMKNDEIKSNHSSMNQDELQPLENLLLSIEHVDLKKLTYYWCSFNNLNKNFRDALKSKYNLNYESCPLVEKL
jgi:hypothetical protein